MTRKSPLRDPELVQMLGNEPELLALADALVETHPERRTDRAKDRRWRRVVVAAVAVLALAVAAVAIADRSPGRPASRALPQTSGLPSVGKQVKTTNGRWSTSATFKYQWLRCAEVDKGCFNSPSPRYTVIPGATAATYTPVAADVGNVLVVRVTATNAEGSASVISTGVGPVEAQGPGLKHKPSITGKEEVGHLLTATTGTWTRAASSWTTYWLRCSATGNACVRIKSPRWQCMYVKGVCIRFKNGVGPDYKLTKNDAGHRIRVRVTAFNGARGATSTSNPTGIIRQ